MDRERRGLVAGVAAYLLWGLFPLYWPLLEPATPVEILAHRIVWSLLVVVALLAIIKGHAWPRGLDARKVKLLALAAVLVTINWATYIYGVNSEQVVETSLGCFINPLVTRSEEHTSELQSRQYLVCRLLLEKKKKDSAD